MTHDSLRRAWRLQDAKARFSEVVRRARRDGPQHITVHGKDAVVVVGSDQFERLCHPGTGAALVRAMADARVRDLDLDRLDSAPPVRDVEL